MSENKRRRSVFIYFLFPLLFFLLVTIGVVCNILALQVYTERVVATVTDKRVVEVKSNDGIIIEGLNGYVTEYSYVYDGNSYTVEKGSSVNNNLEIGSKLFICVNPDEPREFVHEKDKLSIKQMLEPLSTNKWRNGEYTDVALYLQDKFDYDWELNISGKD